MSHRQLAFTTPVTFNCFRRVKLAHLCDARQPRPSVALGRPCVRMEAENSGSESRTAVDPVAESETPKSQEWPPAEMTSEWAEAIERLVNAVPSATRSSADIALDEADGDEALALQKLTDSNWSDIRRVREAAVQAARERGDSKRVSALKEGELRRRATGSARDFFKGYVEIEGKYVDEGYVDQDADAFGKMIGAVRNLFGKNDKK